MTDFLSLLVHFHLESALLAALAGCFWAAWRAASPPDADATSAGDIRRATRLLAWVYAAGLPLLVWDLLAGCFSVHGLGFWLLYPLPSVYFGWAVGRLFRRFGLAPGPARLASLAVLAAVAAGSFLAEFFTLPQVYFYNHVWGGWPGPLYDEVAELDGSLLYFRMLTGAWTLLFWQVPDFSRGRFAKALTAGAALLLVLGYASLAELGIISPESHLRRQLGGHHATAHFDLWYDRQDYSSLEAGLLGRELEFHLSELTDTLNLDRGDFRVSVYLYAHAWQKKELTGAKFTSYVPVWLASDQLHVARRQLGSLRHELVHVVAKRFGNRLLNASWSIGLVEGLAVALAPEPGQRSTADQLVAADPPWPEVQRVRESFSFWGFYRGRAALNYTTGGSFVAYLLREHPVENFKRAYRSGDLPGSYTQPLDSLVAGWHRHLGQVQVDSTDSRRAEQIFGIPSLLEVRCPRVRTPLAMAWDRYGLFEAEGDTLRALASLDRLVALSDSALPILAEWSYRSLQAGRGEEVRAVASLTDSLAELQLIYADAFLIEGDTLGARRHLLHARSLAAEVPGRTNAASALGPALATRSDWRQWEAWNNLVYRGIYPMEGEGSGMWTESAGDTLLTRTLARALDRALEQDNMDAADRVENLLRSTRPDQRHLDTWLKWVHILAYRGESARAAAWLDQLEAIPGLRAAELGRLHMERRWLAFLEGA
ncbi:MAG: hypothetical protein U5K31_07890 [Balneolaceae bacterium]|nr:hypothetical protein [Balneolaceae bacterium]